jgi:hypothetical protein
MLLKPLAVSTSEGVWLFLTVRWVVCIGCLVILDWWACYLVYYVMTSWLNLYVISAYQLCVQSVDINFISCGYGTDITNSNESCMFFCPTILFVHPMLV